MLQTLSRLEPFNLILSVYSMSNRPSAQGGNEYESVEYNEYAMPRDCRDTVQQQQPALRQLSVELKVVGLDMHELLESNSIKSKEHSPDEYTWVFYRPTQQC